MRQAVKAGLLVLLVLLIDQSIKIWVKTHMVYGEEIPLFGLPWALIHFVENNGMAFGISLGGEYGKLALSLFRILAVIFLVLFMRQLIRENISWGVLGSFSLILAGAIGNILDSAFYGIIFSESAGHELARLFPPEGGYSSFLHGKVVDMLYFPIISGYWPDWVPIVGGRYYQFFKPVFNIADFAITLGVLNILFFQRSFLSSKIIHSEPEKDNENTEPEEEISSDLADSAAVDSLQPLENPETPAGG